MTEASAAASQRSIHAPPSSLPPPPPPLPLSVSSHPLWPSSLAAAIEAQAASQTLAVASQEATVPVNEKSYDGTETLDELLDDADALVKDDYPCKAVSVLRRARSLVAASSPSAVDADPRAKAAMECEDELVALLEDIVDTDMWALHGTSRGTTVHTEKPGVSEWAGSKLLRFRVESVLATDIFSAICTVNEIEDFPKWMPGVDQAATRANFSMFRRVIRASGAKPWPLPRDELILQAYGDTCDPREFLGPEASLGLGVAIFIKPAGPEWPRTPGCKRVDLVGG